MPEDALDEYRSKNIVSLFSIPIEPVAQNNAEPNASDAPNKPGPRISCKFKICPIIEEKLKKRNAFDLDELEECLDSEKFEEDEMDTYYSDGYFEQPADKCTESHVVNGIDDEDSGSSELKEQLASLIKIFLRDINCTLVNVNGFW